MRLNISAWAIRKPIPSLVLFTVLLALGLFGFHALPITQFPNIDLPLVAVTITEPGAAPSELQTQVTKRVEDAVAGVSGVKHITSTITEGTSSTTIEFRLETNDDRALNDVKDAVARIRTDLPRTIDEPIVNRVDIAGLPILIYGVSAPAMTPEDLSWFVDDVVARQVQGVRGVGGVERLGGVDREIRVELEPDRLTALGVTAADVNAQLLLTSADLAGGRGDARRAGAVDPHPGRRADDGEPRRHVDHHIRRPPCPARRPRADRRHRRGAAHFRPPRRQTRGRPCHHPRQGRERRRRRRRGRPQGRRPRPRLSRRALQPDRLVRHQHGRQLRFRHARPAGGRGARRARGVHVPARLARHADRRHRAAAVGAADLLGDAVDGLLAQPRQPARHHARHRHPCRRRHRRDREHRPSHQDGEDALPGGA